jgi:hypothetical protein
MDIAVFCGIRTGTDRMKRAVEHVCANQPSMTRALVPMDEKIL